MRHLQSGEKARILNHGVEVQVTVFSQLGDSVYVFDNANRVYQFPISDVLPVRDLPDDVHGLDQACHSVTVRGDTPPI